MPYDRNTQLPKGVRGALPGHAQSIYRNVVNSALASGASEESAHRQAWGAVHRGYKKPKDGGRWTSRKQLAYSSWSTQPRTDVSPTQKEEDEDYFEVDKGYPEYRDDQPRGSDGRWSSGGGSGHVVGEGLARAKSRLTIKDMKRLYVQAKKQRSKLASSIRSLQNRMSQYKSKSKAYRNASVRLKTLRSERAELTRLMGKLSREYASRTKGSEPDWITMAMTGWPSTRPTSRNLSRDVGKVADIFSIRRPYD